MRQPPECSIAVSEAVRAVRKLWLARIGVAANDAVTAAIIRILFILFLLFIKMSVGCTVIKCKEDDEDTALSDTSSHLRPRCLQELA